MRKRVFGKKLNRTTNQRKALFKSLTNALTLHGKIKTTEAKAKSVKGEIEKLITYAKKNANAVQYLQKHVHIHTAERIAAISSVFKDRQGGYLRIVKIGNRKKDNSQTVLLEFVDKIEMVKLSKKREKGTEKKTEKALVKKEAPKVKTELKKKTTKK